MKIELDQTKIDEISKGTIKRLEKENRSLKTKLISKDSLILDLKKEIDTHKAKAVSLSIIFQKIKEIKEEFEYLDDVDLPF